MKKCIPCGKTFTGVVCYQQHMQSEKHKKKVELEDFHQQNKITNDNSDACNLPSVARLFECRMCNISFGALQNYRKHVESLEHANMIKRYTNKDDSEEMIIPCPESEAVDEIDSNLIEMNDDRLINLQECVNQKLYHKSCDICNKKFSGPEPYQQHLASIGHSKKLALNSNNSLVGGLDPPGSNSPKSSRSSVAVNLRMEPLHCKVCDKIFSGPAPYDQHMKSEIHKKKVRNISLLEHYKSNKLNENVIEDETVDSTTGKVENNLHVQLITCNGAECNYTKIDVPDGTLNNFQKDLQVKNSDLILPSIENLDVITTEQLNVTFFDVNSEINFDECNQGNILPHESKETETSSFQKCTLCNVFLKDIDDLLGHYESKEHFLKKWG